MQILYTDKSDEELLAGIPEQYRFFIQSFLRLGEDKRDFIESEPAYEGYCGEDAYLIFCDKQTCARRTIELPTEHTYRVEYIDTWNMTRTELLPVASGETVLTLPGKEGMAILAVRTDR